MKKAISAAVMALTVAGAAAPALARPPYWAPANGYRSHNGDIQYRRNQDGIRYWQGQDGRYYCRRGNGTVGILIGGAAGALVGRALDTRGDRATGTIIGAAAGALLGNHIAKQQTSCR